MRHGATQEQIDALEDFESGPFSDAEKAAFAFAARMTLSPRGIEEAAIERLRAHYDEGQIVEIVAMAGAFNYLNRVANSLEIEPTKPGEGL